MKSKKELALILSKLGDFEEPNVKLEQYKTDSEIAAEVLWFLSMKNEIENKIIADLGCGNGILGIGCLLLKAKKVYFVDKDKKMIETARRNLDELGLKGILVNKDVKDFNKKADIVMENPPFGVQIKNADRVFLDVGMKISSKIYSFHKPESESFLKKYCKNWKVIKLKDFNFVLKKTLKFHKREKYSVRVGFFEIGKDLKGNLREN